MTENEGGGMSEKTPPIDKLYQRRLEVFFGGTQSGNHRVPTAFFVAQPFGQAIQQGKQLFCRFQILAINKLAPGPCIQV